MNEPPTAYAAQPSKPDRPAAQTAGMTTIFGRPGIDWTVVLRRQPAHIIAGQAESGHTNMFEIICCDCGDDPGLDYREVSQELQRTRGPYQLAPGVAAYEQHLKRHPNRQATHRSVRSARDRTAGDRPVHPPGGTGRPDRSLACGTAIQQPREMRHGKRHH